MAFAPTILFVYNRLWHTQQTIEALKKNELSNETDLIIFSDFAKSEASLVKVLEVRDYIKTISGFKSVKIILREKNLGLAKSIIAGVTEIVNEYGNIIVLEDDMVTSPYFLKYMNDGLEKYMREEDVISIHGYVYPVKEKLPQFFFLKGSDCWGWATWKRGWDLFEKDGKKLLDQLKAKGLEKEFNFNGTFDYLNMLEKQVEGKNDSWAIRWYATAFLNNKLTLYPGQSFVINTGNDNSGTHSQLSDNYTVKLVDKYSTIPNITKEHSTESFIAFQNYFKGITPMNFFKKILKKVTNVF